MVGVGICGEGSCLLSHLKQRDKGACVQTCPARTHSQWPPFTKSCLLKLPPSPRSSTGRGKAFLTRAFGKYSRLKLLQVYGGWQQGGGWPVPSLQSCKSDGQAIRCGPAVERKDEKLGEKIRKVACFEVYRSVVVWIRMPPLVALFGRFRRCVGGRMSLGWTLRGKDSRHFQCALLCARALGLLLSRQACCCASPPWWWWALISLRP